MVVTATAVWNLLNVYRKGDTPKEFSELLLALLALDVDGARALHAQPANRVYPPFPEDPYVDDETFAHFGGSPMVSDSSFEVGKNKKKTNAEQVGDEGKVQKTNPFRARARLELCVNRNFERLNVLSIPAEWPGLCPVIWRSMEGDGETFTGKLRLPGIADPEEIRIDFKTVGRTKIDATQTEVVLEMKAPPFIETGYMKFRMEPERGRPGWTRIVHEREVTFFHELRRYEVPTLAYWTKSDIACLALR